MLRSNATTYQLECVPDPSYVAPAATAAAGAAAPPPAAAAAAAAAAGTTAGTSAAAAAAAAGATAAAAAAASTAASAAASAAAGGGASSAAAAAAGATAGAAAAAGASAADAAAAGASAAAAALPTDPDKATDSFLSADKATAAAPKAPAGGSAGPFPKSPPSAAPKTWADKATNAGGGGAGGVTFLDDDGKVIVTYSEVVAGGSDKPEECPPGFGPTGRWYADGTPECTELPSGIGPPIFHHDPEGLTRFIAPGGTFAGPAPPPCDDPPFDYAQEPTCSPNSLAFVPDWTGLSLPFLNEINCRYSVPVQTPDCPEGQNLHPQVVGYTPTGISNLMTFLGKESTPLAESVLTAYVENSAEPPYDPAMIGTRAYETDLSPNTDLKILYKWPFGLVRALRLQSAAASIDGAPAGTANFELQTDGLFRKIDRLGQQLGVYTQEQAQAWGEQQIKIVIAGSAQEINIGEESRQVDAFKSSLNNLLTSNDYTLSQNGSRTVGTQFETAASVSVAERVAFFHDGEYQLAAVYARQRAADYEELGLSILQQDTGLKNATLLSYLSRIDDILFDLDKSSPISLLDFVRKYHYPPVTITDGVQSQLPIILGEGCLGDELINAGKSILDSLAGLDDLFANKFAEYVCMTPEQFARREAQIRVSTDEFESLLKKEASAVLPMSDPLVQSVIKGIQTISNNGPTIFVAWEKLFNKMSMCGLLSLMGKTVEFIAKNDVCGITPEKALMTAITSALKNMKPADLKRVFDGIEPPALRSLIQDRYFETISDFVRDIGSTSGLIFPWDYEERQQTQTEDEERGLILYSADLFQTPAAALPSEYSGSLATAFLQGYRRNAYTAPSGSLSDELEAAYWDGYVQADRDEESDPSGLSPSYSVETGELELSEEQTQRLVNNVRVTLNRQHGASVGRLISGLAADTLNFLIKSIVTSVMGVLGDNLTFDQIIGMFKDIPVLGAILKVLPQVSKCVINTNIKKDGKEVSFSELQKNLFKGGEIDICNLKAGKKPIVLPNIELIMEQMKVSTLWASFQNALIEVLKQVLISILLRTLFGILRKAIETILGFACAATQGNADSFLQGALPPGLVPGGNMRDFLQGALCPGDRESVDPDAELATLMASLLPGLSEGDALSLLGPQSECSFIDRIEETLTAVQLLDLIEGAADPYTLTAVMAILNRYCPDLERLLPSEAAIANFFQNLGTVFPQEYIDQLRSLLATTPAVIGIPANLCDEEELLDNLREALNCEDSATPEQIDAYIDAFQDRLNQTIEDMVATLANGLDSSLTDTIQSTLEELVPKDEPGNLLIAEQIVSLLFDPLYAFYARDLMHPLGTSGRPYNAGMVNMILANKRAVGQTGQMANYAMAVATLSGPMMGIIAMLPPPLNFIASAGAMETLVTNLRLTFFGPEPEDGDADLNRCNEMIPIDRAYYNTEINPYALEAHEDPDDPAPAPPTFSEWKAGQVLERSQCHQNNANAVAAGAGPGPYGHGRLKKPATIAKSLQNIFNDIGDFYLESDESALIRFPTTAMLESNLSDVYSGDGTLFEIVYNFETGLFQFIPYESISSTESPTPRESATAYIARTPPEEWIEIETTNNSRLEIELAEYFGDLPLSAADGLTPLSVGAASLLYGIRSFMPPEAHWTTTPSYSVPTEEFQAWAADCRTLSLGLREGVGASFARSIASNQDAFDYGYYNLEVLADDDVLNPGVELLAKGYNFVYLDDGQIFVEPPPKGGWLQIKDRLLPRTDETFCCPDRKELFDVASIKDRTLEGYKLTEDDPRLALNPKTVNEPPYAHILSRMNLAACEGNIIATIRTYAIEYFLQGYATYNKFPPRVPQVHSDILADYIAQRMKEGLFDQRNEPGAPVWPPGLIPGTVLDEETGEKAEKLHAYWYEFLEQCVQTYSRRIKAGAVEVTGEVNTAMSVCQTAIDNYREPKQSDLRSARQAIITLFLLSPLAPILSPFLPIVLPQVTLKRYRRKVKIDLIRENEASAMIILKQLVREELNRISDNLGDIFDEPPGGRVNDIYLEFLRNGISVGAANIFDVPVDPTDTASPARQLFPAFTDEVVAALQADNFMLQCYIRANQLGSRALDTWRTSDFGGPTADVLFPAGWDDDQIYPLSVVSEMFAAAIDLGLPPDTSLGDFFEADSFKYGLRLVYVPAAGTIYSAPSIFDKMREPSSANNLEGLFGHPPYFGDMYTGGDPLGEFSLSYSLF